MITIILVAAVVLVVWGLALWLRAAAQGHGRAWLRAFWQAWRAA